MDHSEPSPASPQPSQLPSVLQGPDFSSRISSAEEDYIRKTRKALQAGFVQKFEILGLLNLLHLQTKIHRLKTKISPALKALYFPKVDVVQEKSGASGGGNVDTESGGTGGDEPVDAWILKIFERDKDLPPDLSAELHSLMNRLNEYNKALLRQRQILSLPAYDIGGKKGPREHFQYFDEKSLPKRFKYANPALFKEYVVYRNRSGAGEYVSLDPCTCSEICPTGLVRFTDIGTWTQNNVPKNILALLALVFLSMLPSGSMIALYAVPSSWGRLGFIVGESAIVIAALAIGRKLSDGEVLSYMIGIAAVQVIFVGSVISSK